jgi:putative transposase
MSRNLEVGQAVIWQEICYLIKAIKPQLGDIALEGKGGIEYTLPLPTFYNYIASGEIALPGQQVAEAKRAWSDSEQLEAEFRLQLVELFSQLQRQGLDEQAQNAQVDRLCHELRRKRPSNKTILGYQRKYNAMGFAGLIPNFSRRGGSGWAKKEAAKQVAERVLIQRFMSDDKVNLTAVALEVDQQFKQLNESTGTALQLDRKTIGRQLLNLPKSLVKEGRLDPRTFHLWNRQAVRRYDVKHPFERVEIDATTLDLYCSDESGTRYSELTLYAMVCACTSYPVAIHVCAGKPSQYTLLKLLEFFFTPKDQAFKERFQIETDWVQPSAFNVAVLDNASENHALAACLTRRLGFQVEFARIARGDDKPHVESFFKALGTGLLSKMPGAKRSQDKRVKNRHARAEAEACYSINEIYRQIIKYVADHYIHLPRQKLGFRHGKPMTIKMAMDAALQTFMPPPPPSLDFVKRLILDVHRETRKVQHYGLDFEGFQFHSQAFAQFLRERELAQVDIMYNPEDCTAIYAVHPDDASLIRLENKTVGVPQVSFEVAKALKKRFSGHAGVMTGHDYQRVYAEMCAEFAKDSLKRPKIKANNRAVREQEKATHQQAIAEQIDKCLPASGQAVRARAEDDDDFMPARREERQP